MAAELIPRTIGVTWHFPVSNNRTALLGWCPWVYASKPRRIDGQLNHNLRLRAFDYDTILVVSSPEPRNQSLTLRVDKPWARGLRRCSCAVSTLRSQAIMAYGAMLAYAAEHSALQTALRQ